jgi:hypothetical protein
MGINVNDVMKKKEKKWSVEKVFVNKYHCLVFNGNYIRTSLILNIYSTPYFLSFYQTEKMKRK